MSSTAANQPIAIIGSTGVQGSGVLNSLLTTSHPIRALTRSAAKLEERVKKHPTLSVIDTDITNPASLKAALTGAWALFVNTFSDYSKPEGTEEALLKSIILAAAQSGVQYLVLSTLPSGMPARAYIEKAKAMDHAREISRTSTLKPIFVEMGWYMTGFSTYMQPVVNPDDGFVEFRWSTITPQTLFPLVSAATDLGPVVKAILEDPDKWVNTEVPVVGDVLTIPQVAAIYSKVTGQPARAMFVDHIPQESLPSWVERHSGYRDVGYFPKYSGREQDIPLLARQLYPGMKTFEQWLRETGYDAKRA